MPALSRGPFLLAVSLAAIVDAPAQIVPTNFVVDTIVSTGLTAPHDFCFLPDGRVLIANRPGIVTVHANGASATVGTVPNVEVFGIERSLVSICADPGFATNGYVYTWSANSLDAFLHLDRFTCTGLLADPTSTNLSFTAASQRTVLLTLDNAANHNGGTLRFGPDGMLYLTFGDDVSSCDAQNLTVMRGKLLRMNVSALPAGGSTTAPTADQLDPGDNPLSANTDFSQLVIGYGLRNPFRFTIDPATNHVYIGDVGLTTFEEIDEYAYQPGALQLVNYGWPWREGTANNTTCTGTLPTSQDPIATAAYNTGWSAIVGGPRYRNAGVAHDFGASYEGSLFFADYTSGRMRRLAKVGATWTAAPAVPGQPTATEWGNGFQGATSFQVGPDGAIWFTQHQSVYGFTNGMLKRIRPLGPINGIAAVSGGGQVGVAAEPFALPLVARVLDPQGAPLPSGSVTFSIAGPGALSTSNPVLADANGLVQTTVTANDAGGAITVTATPTGGTANTTFALFSRDLTVGGTATTVVVSITHKTAATPANVPWLLMAQFAGAPPLPTAIGPICTNPLAPGFFALEDSFGLFGYVTLSGTFALGTPSITKTYLLPAGLLTGTSLNLQAVGLDPIEGLVRTDCVMKSW